jgi:hypothetical protein
VNTTQEIKLSSVRQEIDGWRRYIYLTKGGVEYQLTLFWDQFNGYEIMWGAENDTRISKAPDWANDWDEDDNNGISLAGYLDELTCEVVEG